MCTLRRKILMDIYGSMVSENNPTSNPFERQKEPLSILPETECLKMPVLSMCYFPGLLCLYVFSQVCHCLFRSVYPRLQDNLVCDILNNKKHLNKKLFDIEFITLYFCNVLIWLLKGVSPVLGHLLRSHKGLTGEERESNSNCQTLFHVVRRAH